MAARVLEFDPSELKVLETFTFEEEIQRPESVRFYTLDEQVTDQFERLIPTGKVNKFQLEQLQKNADRVRKLQEKTIVPTEEAQEVVKERPHEGFLPWILPVQESFTRPAYNFEDLSTLVANPRDKNYYNRLLGALPKPFESSVGIRTSFDHPQHFADDKGEHRVRALPDFVKTRGILHEDGRQEVVSDSVGNTGDDLRLKGYFVEKRPLALISPLASHPILGSDEPHFLNVTASYAEVVPSLDAILTHAVPTTPHPFKDAAPYLKLYDVQWSDIPWSSWKSKFPSADAVTQGLPAAPIEIPVPDRDLPSENLQKNYPIPQRPGMSPRQWLKLQKDGGTLASQMMMTQASEAGVVALPNPIQLPPMNQAPARPEDCLPNDITFEDFVNRGFYRDEMCVPLEMIAKERAELGTRGRLAWTDTTEKEILENQVRRLKDVVGFIEEESKIPVLPKFEIPPLSESREEIVQILKDDHRTPEDKATDIRKIIQDFPLKGKLVVDEKDQFVVCQHSLSMLEGQEWKSFQETWCAIVTGKLVCKECGEEVSRQDQVQQDEFDDEGHVLTHAEVTAVPEFHPGGTTLQNLQSLRARFDLTDPAQDLMFLLFSILQILPDQSQLDPVLNQVKKLSAPNKKYGESAQAIQGLVGTGLLMQIHEPFLLPRRSFGRTFLLTGQPREGDGKDPGILDSLLNALKFTQEQFRNLFKGPSKTLIKDVYRESSKVREKCLKAMEVMVRPPASIIDKLKLENFTPKLEMAAHRYAKAPPVPPALTSLVPNLVIDRKELAKVTAAECVPPAKISFWTTPTPPRQGQVPMKFTRATAPGITAERISESVSERNVWTPGGPSGERLKAGLPKFVQKMPLLYKTLTENVSSMTWRTASAIAGRLLDRARDAPGVPAAILRGLRKELESLGPSKQSPAERRDVARGIAFKISQEVDKVPGLREIWSETLMKDLSLLALLRTLPEVDREVLQLRTQERVNFVKRLGEKSDLERTLISDLMKANMAPQVMLLKDRQLFAEQLQTQLEQALVMPEEVPEDGFPRTREDLEQNDPDQGERGEQGDMANRPQEGNDIQGN